MNKKELIEIVRKVVREEVERSLPNILVEVLAEKVVNKSVMTESEAPSHVAAPRRKPPVGLDSPMKMAPVRPPKVFSSNPILNEVLNQTQGGVPQDDVSMSMLTESADAPIPPTGASVHDIIKHVSPDALAENPAVASVASALTKDYSKLLKAVDAKARASRPA